MRISETFHGMGWTEQKALGWDNPDKSCSPCYIKGVRSSQLSLQLFKPGFELLTCSKGGGPPCTVAAFTNAC